MFAFLLECVGNVFEEDETKADVLVFRSVHVPAHLIGGGPELGFEVEGRAVGFWICGFRFRHCARVAKQAPVAKRSVIGLELLRIAN